MFFGSYTLRRIAAVARRNGRCFRSASLLLLDVVRELTQGLVYFCLVLYVAL